MQIVKTKGHLIYSANRHMAAPYEQPKSKIGHFMTAENTPDRELFETFAADRRFSHVRKLRLQHADPMALLRGKVNNFRQGERELTTASALDLRALVLRMLQLQHAVTEACEIIPAEYSAVKSRILADFDTQQPMAYMAQVNDWLRLIEGVLPVSP